MLVHQRVFKFVPLFHLLGVMTRNTQSKYHKIQKVGSNMFKPILPFHDKLQHCTISYGSSCKSKGWRCFTTRIFMTWPESSWISMTGTPILDRHWRFTIASIFRHTYITWFWTYIPLSPSKKNLSIVSPVFRYYISIVVGDSWCHLTKITTSSPCVAW